MLVLGPAPAAAKTIGSPPAGAPLSPEAQLVTPALDAPPPPGFRVNGRAAVKIAEAVTEVRKLRRREPRLDRQAQLSTLPLADGTYLHWEVVYGKAGKDLVEVDVGGRTGRVLEVWTGPQISLTLARGYPGTLGRSVNNPYVWLVLSLIFVIPFFDWRRPFRLLHFDIVALLAFTIPLVFFLRGDLEASTWLILPPLVYVIVRAGLVGFGRPRGWASGPLCPLLGKQSLTVLLVLLVALRIAFTLGDARPVDISYASVIGADRVAHGQELYVDNDVHGDTYGPLTYVAYIPFEAIWPVDPSSGSLPAARAATIAFDLLTILGLLLVGVRWRRGPAGTTLGLALAVAWAAYPFSWHVLAMLTNDGLVTIGVLAAVLVLAAPRARGAVLALATLTKFVPGTLVGLFARGRSDPPGRTWAAYAAVYAAVIVAAVLFWLPDGGLAELWNTTLGYQLGRESALTIWALHPGLEPLHAALEILVIGFAAALAFVPAERSYIQVAALAAACIAAFELVMGWWIYAYTVWFVPPLLAALFAAHSADEPVTGGRRATARPDILPT